MTTGEKLLLSCLKRKDSKVLSVIQRKWLDGGEVVEHRFIMDYYKEHGELVTAKEFCEKFDLDKSEADSRPTYYLKAIKERFIFASLTDEVPKILRGLKEDPRGKLETLQGLVSELATDNVESRDTLYSDDVDSRKKDYEERVKSSGVTYLSMGCPDLDKAFFGYQPTDVITIGGKAGQGKSWLLVFLAFQLEKVLRDKEEETGKTYGDILFITNEMSEKEIKERLDCLKFRLPYKRFLEGTLTERERRRYFNGLDEMKEVRSKLRIVYSCQTIDELSTLIGLYQPPVVFVDGSYLMEGKMQEGWEKITYITRNFKRLAKNFKTPIINTTQLKRGSSKSGSRFSLDGQDDFAYSSSYTQDSDIAIRMYQDADMKFHDVVGCEVVKGRRVVGGTTMIFQNDLDRMLHSVTLKVEDDAKEPEYKEDY